MLGNIFVNSDQANESISKTDKKAQGLSGRLGEGIKVAGKWGAKLTAAAVASGAALFGMATKAMDTLDRIDKLSQKIGLSRQGFQEWEYVLSQSGTDIEKLQVGLKTMVQRMEESAKGTGVGAEAFRKLKLDAVDPLTGALKSQEQMFEETIRAMQRMPEGAEKSRLAFELFGKAGMELMPLLNDSNESLDAMKNKAHELGIVISDDAVDAGVVFQDTMDDLKRSLGAIVTNIGASVIPMFQRAADWVIEHMPQIQTVIKTVFAGIELAVNVFVGVIEWLGSVFTALFEGAATDGEGLKEWFTGFVDWGKEIFALLADIIEVTLEAIREFWERHGDNIMRIVKPLWEGIKIIVDTTMRVIKGILNTVLAIIQGDWSKAWEGVSQIFRTVWEGMKNLLPNLLEALFAIMRGAFGIFKDLGRGMFNMVWEGLKSVWSGIAGWISDKVSWLTDKLFFWRKSKSEIEQPVQASQPVATTATTNRAVHGSHATGLQRVPFDGYIAELHKDEEVLTAEEARKPSVSVTNEFRGMLEGAVFHVREDADVDKIAEALARKLHIMQQGSLRAQGVTG